MASQEVTFGEVDYWSDEQMLTVARMQQAYDLEEFTRTARMPCGLLAASYLNTGLLWVDGTPVGAVSYDREYRAIETIYLLPEYRGFSLASTWLRILSSGCPGTLTLKGPLSPNGQALADRLGLGMTPLSADQKTRYVTESADWVHKVNASCPHPRKGNPQKPCPRCARGHIRFNAQCAVGLAALAIRLARHRPERPPIVRCLGHLADPPPRSAAA